MPDGKRVDRTPVRQLLFTSTGQVRAGYRAVLGLVLMLLAAAALPSLVAFVPGPFDDAAHQATTFGAVLGIAWLFATVLDGRPVVEYGFALDRRWYGELLGGFVLAAAITGGTNLLLVGLGLAEVTAVTVVGDAGSYLPGFADFAFVLVVFTTLFVGIAWEVLGFYGIVMQETADGLGSLLDDRLATTVALLCVSLLFGVLHYSLGGPLAAVWYGLLGIAVGIAYTRTASLAAPIGLRAGWAIGYAVLVGFSPSPGPRIVAIDRTRDELFMGMAGTILVASALFAVILIASWCYTNRPSQRYCETTGS